ncbi:hypothetical protein VIGAN_05259200, partial [Vigna angularis var. angularis]
EQTSGSCCLLAVCFLPKHNISLLASSSSLNVVFLYLGSSLNFLLSSLSPLHHFFFHSPPMFSALLRFSLFFWPCVVSLLSSASSPKKNILSFSLESMDREMFFSKHATPLPINKWQLDFQILLGPNQCFLCLLLAV